MIKKLFLHIGMHKTGTSSLQHFLDIYSDELLRQGFYVPVTGGIKHRHHSFAFELKKEDNLEKTFKDNPIWENLKLEIKSTPADKIIMSSEEFSLISPKAIQALKVFFKAYDVKIYIYIRRQSDMVESVYNQDIKDINSSEKKSIENWLQEQEAFLYFHLDYYQKILKWEEVFGIDNIVVRVYDSDRLFYKNTVSDFFSLLDINIEHDNTIRKNRSVSIKALELIRLSKHIKMEVSERKKIFDLAQKYFPYKKENNYLLTKNEKIAIDNRCLASNEMLKNKYFSELKSDVFSDYYKENDKKIVLTKIDILHVLSESL